MSLRLIGILLAAGLAGGCEQPNGPKEQSAPPAAADLAPVSVGEEIGSFYRGRDFRPLWISGRRFKPEALEVLRQVEAAALHGLDPARYQPDRLRRAIAAARGQDPQALARAELLISSAYSDFIHDLRAPPEPRTMVYVDDVLRPSPAPSTSILLERLAGSREFGAQVKADLGLNPLYDRLTRGFADYFERWAALPQLVVPTGPGLAPGSAGERVGILRQRLGLGRSGDRYDDALRSAVRRFEQVHGLAADGVADAATIAALNRGYRHYERIIQANLERAKAIPAEAGERFVLVDTAGARLWLFERGGVADSMRAIVGKPGMATPDMAGLIRYVALNPYWNIPPDLIRSRVAKGVLRQGVSYIRRERLQLLADWRDDAPILSPASVDWKAVASGRSLVRVRQLPGPGNMMGDIKFMLPNKLDIYLHDTPDKKLFQEQDRRLSSGCVRVEDSARLSRWLFRGAEVKASGSAPEQRVDLPEPVPVYILHLTARPGPGGILFQPDGYGRDAPLKGVKPAASAQVRAR